MVDARRLRTLCAAAIAAMATCICAAGDAPTCPWFSSCSRRGLRLRGGWAPRQVGGQGPGPDEDMTDDNIRRSLNDSYYEYEVGAGLGGPGDRKHLPDELTSSALDVVRLRFVPRDALSNSAAHQSFHAYAPLYAHQLFGEDECIYGYISPEIDITYSEDSLLPVITFTHVPRQDAGGLACPVPPSATDVLGSIQRKAPADYFSPDQLPPSKRRFEPRGTRVGDYSGYALGRSKPEHGAVESERGGDVRYEVYSIRAGADIGAQKVLLQRAQSIAMWMIESASYIDFEDPNWSCVFVYEKTSPWALGMDSNTAVHDTWPSKDAVGAGATYRLVAFTTLYRAPLPRGISLEGLREISPRADELWEKRDSVVRLNVSQFVVLPHFAGQGHGKQLLRHVYREAQADKAVLDVRVEQPTEIFRNMRQSVELELLRDKDKLADLRCDNPPWQQLQAKLKFSMARLFALANHVGCKAGVAGISPSSHLHAPVDLSAPPPRLAQRVALQCDPRLAVFDSCSLVVALGGGRGGVGRVRRSCVR